ncbi:restriction endonuclease subunit S [uncultured Clostridium sp.]|uniref:restriction endonuclease subunit S n=1 Tax=uncultured Clostridium sp. TaxID=59620 RepID=UPI0025841473|nr:restriction endonuclease subunit S [uncultured Clostridium sp.]
MSRNVPKLRFKGFEDEWKEKKMALLGTFLKGNGISKSDLSESGKECILYGELYTTYGEVIESIKSKTDISLKNEVLSKINDVIIPSSGESAIDIATASCVMKDNILLGGDLNVFRSNKDNGVFISYQLNNSKKKDIAKIAQGASVVHIYNEQLKQLKVNIPSLEEQEKIANFLSKVDSIIEKQEKKVEYWNSYKKGMMQKIFSQKIRFKDENGMDYPEWEKKNLKYVLSEISEKTKENNQYEVLSSTANGVFKQSEYFNREIASADNTGYKILRLNQIVLSPQNLWLGNINYNNKYDMGIVSPSYKIFNINKNLNEKYISYIIKTDRMLYGYKQASEQGASVVRRNLNMDLFYDILINIPCVEEQEKIANFLSNIDNIIEKESKKLEELKQWKKGLLQQMFV